MLAPAVVIRRLGLVVAALVAAAGCSSGRPAATPASSTPATSAQSTPFAGYASATYADPAHWLCRPDFPATDDDCRGNLDTTSVSTDGRLTVQRIQPAANASFDCFYVYPTVDSGPGLNEALDVAHPSETAVVRAQAAPFSRVCNVYAPLYRQVTLAGLFKGGPAGTNPGVIAYADVLDAFRYYLGHYNHGRPFVLLGHSQGSALLARVVADQIDGTPALRHLLVSAVLPGASIQVPVGSVVGGTFKNVPGCQSAHQHGCVIGYSSFRATAPPPPNSFFGRSSGPGMQDLCTNPASLSGGTGTLSPTFDQADTGGVFALAHSVVWAPGIASPPPITTPYVSLPELVTSACTTKDGFTYLSLAINQQTGPRAHNVPGDLTPQWGMHLIDVNVALPNLVDVVQQQAAAVARG